MKKYLLPILLILSLFSIAQGTSVSKGFNVLSGTDVELRHGQLINGLSIPFTSVAQANAATPLYRRFIGLEKNIIVGNVQLKYWYVGGIADGNLVLQNPTATTIYPTVIGQNYLNISNGVITASPIDLSNGNVTNQLPNANIANPFININGVVVPLGGTTTLSTGPTVVFPNYAITSFPVVGDFPTTLQQFVNLFYKSASLSILTQPLSQTIVSGATATFSVVAIGGQTPYVFQWLLNGAAISGATSTTYSTGTAGTYTCTITDAALATVTSNQAILTVRTITPPPQPTTIQFVFSYFADDPFVDNFTPIQMGNPILFDMYPNADIVFSVPLLADNQYYVIKVSSSEPIKTSWYQNQFSSGTIPDQTFRAAFTVNGYTYYVTRAAFVLDATYPMQLR